MKKKKMKFSEFILLRVFFIKILVLVIIAAAFFSAKTRASSNRDIQVALQSVHAYMDRTIKKYEITLPIGKMENLKAQADEQLSHPRKLTKRHERKIKRAFKKYLQKNFPHKFTPRIIAGEIGYRKSLRKVRNAVKQFLRTKKGILNERNISKRWNNVKSWVNVQHEEKSYINKFDKIVLKRFDVQTIIDGAIRELDRKKAQEKVIKKKIERVKRKSLSRPALRKPEKYISLRYAETKVKRLIERERIKPEDKKQLFQSIMDEVRHNARIESGELKAIAHKAFKNYHKKY